MASTNKTTYYELSQYIGTDKPSYLGDYNSDMRKIDAGLHSAADDASTALSTANSAASTASDAATAASAATTTANTAKTTAESASETAATASTNASAALTAAQGAETAAAANTITNLAPAYDPTLTYAVGDLVTFIDAQGSGKLYKCIIAVDTPMTFNINYWDDVTTSEAYSRKPIELIFSHDDYTSYSDLYAAARTAILNTPDWIKRKIDLISPYNGTYPTLYHLGAVDDATTNPVLRFFTALGATSGCSVRGLNISSDECTGYTWKMDTNGTTVTTRDMSEAPSRDTILSIF